MNPTVSANPLSAKTGPAVTTDRINIKPLHSYLVLAKPRIVSLVVFTAVVACFAAAHGHPPLATVLLLVVSGSLAAGGAAALNHYFDRDIDGRMTRTRQRPLVRGEIPRPGLVLVGGIATIVVGVFLGGSLHPLLGFFELLGAVVYAGIYTLWLKRRTPLNIVIGGAAGSSAVLGGWAAVDPSLGIVPWLLGGLVFFWTPAHFWGLALARRGDYEQASVPMLPSIAGPRRAAWWIVIHIVVTIALSIWIGLAAQLGEIYFLLALIAGLAFLASGGKLLRQPEPETAWQVFKLSGPYLGLVFLGVLLDTLF